MSLFGGGGTFGSLVDRLASSEIASHLIQALGPAVMQGVLDRLNQTGYGAEVNSWLGRGANQPITADEIRGALGDARLQELAKTLGIPVDKLGPILAQHLPAAVDKAAESGTIAAPR